MQKKITKEYVPEDPNLDPILSDSLLVNSDSSEGSNYKHIIEDKKKNT